VENLCIDIGNTRIKAIYYSDDQVSETIDFSHEDIDWTSLVEARRLDGIAISNVSRREDFVLIHHAAPLYVNLDHHTPVPFLNLYTTPETLGRDRIAAVLGALAMFPDDAACVIDIGTCVTYDYIDQERRYHGGNISPGVNLRLRAMHEFTDGLPLLDLVETTKFLGDSTQSAMMCGAMDGLLYEIEGFLERLDEVSATPYRTILTGGGAEYFGKKLKKEIFVNPFLIPYGLNSLLRQLSSDS